MPIERTERYALLASGRHGFQSADLKVRKSNVDLEALKKAIAGNGRDELIVRSDRGDLYVIDAVSLSVPDAAQGAKLGDRLKVGKLEGNVVWIDQDPPRAKGYAGVGMMAGGVLALPLAAKAVVLALGMSSGVGIAVGGGLMIAAWIGAAIIDHRSPDDRALADVTTTLASSKNGSLAEIERQLA